MPYNSLLHLERRSVPEMLNTVNFFFFCLGSSTDRTPKIPNVTHRLSASSHCHIIVLHAKTRQVQGKSSAVLRNQKMMAAWQICCWKRERTIQNDLSLGA
ncbi:hypothetical protein I7I53_10615 [Histoplasma capsulatum var. duboisii H88]|uniref:Uncharacterized protein n=1 Tax=Ajellomyces capsulatus (strain H88) TaxID=544711 RepID=A0A8A1L8V3_AJEC8|nr:hypothetical protein I7I53_10615 [Histoplasma capsulatum var. duboisii H88]